MKKKFICFTHYDLDGIVCYLLLKHFFNIQEVLYCGYGKIDSKIDYICSKADEFDGVVVSDLSLSENQFNKLEKCLKEKNKDFYLYDHHDSSIERFKDRKPYGILSTKFSAAGLIFSKYIEYFKKMDNFESIRYLVIYTNKYDTWQIESDDFKKGYVLTELFRMIGWNKFCLRFKNGYSKIDKNEIKEINEIVNRKMEKLKKIDQFIYDDENGKGVVFITDNGDDVINDSTIFYRDYNFHIMISTETKTINVRHTKDADLSKIFSKIFSGKDDICNFGGHKRAGSFMLNILDMVKLNEYLEEIKKLILSNYGKNN